MYSQYHMSLKIGPFDPVVLVFNVMNALMEKKIISYEEARSIIKQSLDSNLSEEDKEKILDSMIRKKE